MEEGQKSTSLTQYISSEILVAGGPFSFSPSWENSFFHQIFQQIFPKHLLYARHASQEWRESVIMNKIDMVRDFPELSYCGE